MRKLFKGAMVLLVVIALVCFAIIYYANYVSSAGDEASRWIRFEMWKAKYFNNYSVGLSIHELANVESLRSRASENKELVNFVGGERCEEVTELCALSKLAAANLLIDSGGLDKALGLVESARSVQANFGLCSINVESSVLLYKLRMLSNAPLDIAGAEARAVVERIKSNGGVISDLRSRSCDLLAERKPLLFHEYVRLVSRVMSFAGGDLAKGSAYIDSEDYIGK